MANTVSHPDPEKQLSLFDPIEIPLTKGYVALVDPIDSDLLTHRWNTVLNKHHVYACRHMHYSRKPKYVYMHRLIMTRLIGRDLVAGEEVDHIDGNSLNNRRSNLRVATHKENTRNRKRPSTNSSGFKGAYKSSKNRWLGAIWVDGKLVRLGMFDTAKEAHVAYCEAAKKYFGEYARCE